MKAIIVGAVIVSVAVIVVAENSPNRKQTEVTWDAAPESRHGVLHGV